MACFLSDTLTVADTASAYTEFPFKRPMASFSCNHIYLQEMYHTFYIKSTFYQIFLILLTTREFNDMFHIDHKFRIYGIQ